MDTSTVANYSVRLHPQHRQMLATVARLAQRSPANVVRHLIRSEYERLTGRQEQQSQEAGDA